MSLSAGPHPITTYGKTINIYLLVTFRTDNYGDKVGMASFMSAELVHESRNSSAGAHRLAKSSVYESIGRHVWLLSPPHGVYTRYYDIE